MTERYSQERKILSILILLLFAASSVFAAVRNLAITPISCTYDLTAGYQGTFTVTYEESVRRQRSFLTFSAGSSGTFTTRTLRSGANSLNYNIYTTTALTYILKTVPPATVNEVISLRADTQPNGTWRPVSGTFVVNIPASQFLPAGPYGSAPAYTDTITVRLYNRAYQSPNPGAIGLTLNFTITCAYPTITNVSVVDTGAAGSWTDTTQTLDFGVLSGGQFLDCDLFVRSNVRINLTVLSANQGVLRHTVPSITDTIVYEFRFGGVLRDLSGALPVTILNLPGITTSTGVSNTVRVDIPALAYPAEGNYSDSLTVTIVTY